MRNGGRKLGESRINTPFIIDHCVSNYKNSIGSTLNTEVWNVVHAVCIVPCLFPPTWYTNEAGLQIGLEVLLAGLRDGVQRTDHNPTALSPGTLSVKVVQYVRSNSQESDRSHLEGGSNICFMFVIDLLLILNVFPAEPKKIGHKRNFQKKNYNHRFLKLCRFW